VAKKSNLEAVSNFLLDFHLKAMDTLRRRMPCVYFVATILGKVSFVGTG